MPIPTKLHDFEGGQYTAPQIQKMMPIYNVKTVRAYLAAGAKTRAEMHALAHQRQMNSIAQGRKNAAKNKHTNHALFVKKGKTNA